LQHIHHRAIDGEVRRESVRRTRGPYLPASGLAHEVRLAIRAVLGTALGVGLTTGHSIGVDDLSPPLGTRREHRRRDRSDAQRVGASVDGGVDLYFGGVYAASGHEGQDGRHGRG